MEISLWGYAYLIMMIAAALCAAGAARRKDWELFPAFLASIPLAAIGFSCNYQICPLIFCLG